MTANLLSLVIPCYNEAAGLPELLARLNEVFFGWEKDVELILVDNGSTDDSWRILTEAANQHMYIRTVRVEINQGYGYGILQGLAAAKGGYLGWTHADLQTDPADALLVLESLKGNASDRTFYKGRRFGRPLADVFFTVGMSLFESLLFSSRLWDINAQPTIFPRDFFESWSNPPYDFSLDLYAYASARRCNLNLNRVPVNFAPRLHGASHWNVDWRSKLKFIRRTWSYSLSLRRSWSGLS